MISERNGKASIVYSLDLAPLVLAIFLMSVERKFRQEECEMRVTRSRLRERERESLRQDDSSSRLVFEHRDEKESKRIRKMMSPRALLGAIVSPERSTLRRMFSDRKRSTEDFMDHQKDVTFNMRHILIDWIVDVCFEFHLGPQSLFVSVEITDYVLSRRQITKDRLQLLGICAMILACNVVNHGGIMPTYGDFSYISDNTYSVEEISAEVDRIKADIGTTFRDRLTLYNAIVHIFTDLPHWMNDVKVSLLMQDSLRVVVEAQKNAELAIMYVVFEREARENHSKFALECTLEDKEH